MQTLGLQQDLSEQAKRDRARAGRAVGGKRRSEEDRLPQDVCGKRSDPPESAPVKRREDGEDKTKERSAPKRDTRQEAAESAGISRHKVEKAKMVADAAPDLADKVASGELTLAEAVRTVKRAAVVEQLESVTARAAKAAAGVYDVIVIDPPWPMEKIERDERPNQVAFDYPTMSESELAALTVPCADDAHVWVWTTHKFLPMALRLVETWDLRYVCTFTWHKPGGFQPIGLPQYNCEFAIYARKGSPTFVDTKAFPTCFEAPRGKHSEKPEAFYDVVRRVTAGRRLDMFNRRMIDGFDGWGKEAAE
jgi:N6-adenosine-specific RNA methylase IME4